MPWYTNPVITCKVLNRIANRHNHTVLSDLKSVLDYSTELIWKKQEQYYENCRKNQDPGRVDPNFYTGSSL